MVKRAVVMLLALGMVGQVSADERGFLARFEGGIGVIPVSNGAGPANADGTLPDVRLNVVRGVSPGAGPWRIADLRANVDTAVSRSEDAACSWPAANSIGQNANQRVFATLICEAAAPFIARSTDVAGVPLEPNGDFRIDDTLNPAPSECASPVLLIRNTGGVWFAAGIAKFGDDD